MSSFNQNPYSVRWTTPKIDEKKPERILSNSELEQTWLQLSHLIAQEYKEYNTIYNYLALIERKVTVFLQENPSEETPLMEYANQLEDVLMAMDIDSLNRLNCRR